jgi:hypothetical protein
MKIKKGFVLRVVAGESVVVPVGELSKSFHGMINLNETGAFLWKQVEKGTDLDGLKRALLTEYEVDETIAERDAKKFLDKLTEAGLVE